MTSHDTGPALSDEKLTAAERKLVDHVLAAGTIADMRARDAGLDDPACGKQTGGENRTVRAELLAGLLTTEQVLRGGRPRAVKLYGARITGPLTLEARTLTCPLLLQDCYIDEPADLSEATAPSIRLPGCHLPAPTARQLRATGDVDLAGGSALRGGVNLSGAQIGGRLNLTGLTAENASRPSAPRRLAHR